LGGSHSAAMRGVEPEFVGHVVQGQRAEQSMGSLRPKQNTKPTASTEVEFALVLSRIIDSVENDPEHLRAAVYELARHKLKEQFGSEEAVDMQQLSHSLEVAIQGVEAFVAKNDRTEAWLGRPALGLPTAQTAVTSDHQESVSLEAEPIIGVRSEPTYYSAAPRTKSRFTMPWRFALVIAMALVVSFAVKQRVIEIDILRTGISQSVGSPSVSHPTPAEVVSFRERTAAFDSLEPPTSPLTPTTYGVFAVSGDRLYELDPLPGRAPDIRIPISAAILTPSRTSLPDGHIKFIVYRRDSATRAADRADIRLVARIAHETNFDKSGKPVISKIDDTWAIRNISVALRTAPKKDHPDMYEVQSGDPNIALTPGRYALVLSGQAYDFSVAGAITDPKQCLERLEGTNGTFYSDCRNP
jgi:hypothetical protein